MLSFETGIVTGGGWVWSPGTVPGTIHIACSCLEPSTSLPLLTPSGECCGWTGWMHSWTQESVPSCCMAAAASGRQGFGNPLARRSIGDRGLKFSSEVRGTQQRPVLVEADCEVGEMTSAGDGVPGFIWSISGWIAAHGCDCYCYFLTDRIGHAST